MNLLKHNTILKDRIQNAIKKWKIWEEGLVYSELELSSKKSSDSFD